MVSAVRSGCALRARDEDIEDAALGQALVERQGRLEARDVLRCAQRGQGPVRHARLPSCTGISAEHTRANAPALRQMAARDLSGIAEKSSTIWTTNSRPVAHNVETPRPMAIEINSGSPGCPSRRGRALGRWRRARASGAGIDGMGVIEGGCSDPISGRAGNLRPVTAGQRCAVYHIGL